MLPCHWCLLLSEWGTLGSFEMCSTSFWMQTKVSDFLLVVRQWSAQAKEVILVLFFAYDVDAIEFAVTWRWIWLWSDSIILMSIDFHFHSRLYDMPKFAFHQVLIIQAPIIKDRNNCIQGRTGHRENRDNSRWPGSQFGPLPYFFFFFFCLPNVY